jgi:hypothetical protein
MGWISKLLVTGVLSVLVTAAGVYGWLVWYSHQVKDPTFFEDDIVAFEAERVSAEHPIVFVGSSSIRMWDTLAEDMAPLPVLNRGFGGSQMFHLVFFAERIIGELSPAAVLVYEGDNDLDESTGKRAEDVLADYQQFVSIVHRKSPDTLIYFLTIKPSRLRWDRWPEMSRANRLIEEWSERDPRLRYIDTTPAILGPDGMPRDDVFIFDGLHLNHVGYAGWTAIVKPRLMDDLGERLGAGRGATPSS